MQEKLNEIKSLIKEFCNEYNCTKFETNLIAESGITANGKRFNDVSEVVINFNY